ncbi:hypothetical protein DAPPUDRAFT_330077 [Daphnia pulex]|uniref:Uncharacterized protein n=1 Tax=Daphnia pulex TaxID=6669 RepID=E9HIH4_DAPPU|nr:hypothetical protein DAPPUDRAFT_330077 [Daphnia pulex]|eukprot:EFX68431.1 hypothetical protein DAPPUDRAFT_330077 [Daphnia pulex]
MASSSVMNKLPTKKMPNPIQEFAPDDIAIGQYTFYLRNNDYLPYTLVFQPCPEANQGTPLLLSLIKTQSKK